MITVPGTLVSRNAVLLGMSLFAFGLVCFVAVPVYSLFSEQGSEIQDALQQLGQYNARTDAAPALARALRSLQDRGRSYPGVIVSDGIAIAQAQLQGDVKTIVETNKGTIQSAQIMPPSASEGFDLIAVQYDMTVPMTHLKDLLFGIEAHTPYLFVDHVEIDAPISLPTQDTIQSDPLLQVHWVVHGYRWASSR